MIRKIIQYPDDILHTVCSAVEHIDDEIVNLVKDMKETMVYSQGIGLAAIQIGVTKRIFIMDIAEEVIESASSEGPTQNESSKDYDYSKIKVFINPEIIAKTGTVDYEEGCLSVKGIYAKVTRAAEIELKYQNELGTEVLAHFSGLSAICIQHEIDHLDGVVFVERLSRLKQDLIMKKIKKTHHDM